MPLDCSKCNGKCCRHVVSMLDRGDGTCKHFNEDTHRCEVYDSRPLICDVDKFYDKFMRGVMSREKWYQMQYEACKKIPD